MNGTTDLLLVAAPFYHVLGEEGRVYVYRLNAQVGDSLVPIQVTGVGGSGPPCTKGSAGQVVGWVVPGIVAVPVPPISINFSWSSHPHSLPPYLQ